MYYYIQSHSSIVILFFFFNDTATTEIYTLSLHDALPIFCTWGSQSQAWSDGRTKMRANGFVAATRSPTTPSARKIGKHTSELQSPCNLVCRLLLEKKKT